MWNLSELNPVSSALANEFFTWTMSKSPPDLLFILLCSALCSRRLQLQDHLNIINRFVFFPSFYFLFIFLWLQKEYRDWVPSRVFWGHLSSLHPSCAGGHIHCLEDTDPQVPSTQTPPCLRFLGTTLFCCPFRPRSGFSFLLFQR